MNVGIVRQLGILLWGLVICSLLAVGDCRALESRRVLLVSSYHPGFPTFFQQIEGVRSAFAGSDILLDVEFMDSKRFDDQASIDRFAGMLSEKISILPRYDVVMCADDNAFNFLLERKTELFPGQPLVFFGVNNVVKALAQNSVPDITGVIEAVSMRETIEVMVRLQPATRRILALVDSTPSGQGDLANFNRLPQIFPGLTFASLSLQDLSFAEFARELQAVGSDTGVLLLSAYVDRTGARMSFEASRDLILQSLAVPVFHLWYHGIGQGLAGGKVISHFEQGREAGGIVRRLLDGKDAATIPVMDQSPNRYVFDYAVLERFGLDPDRLPDGTELINEPVSYVAEHIDYILLTLSFVLLQSAVILYLVKMIAARRKTESALKESEERYFSLFADNHSVMLLIDPATLEIIDANHAAATYYGYTLAELIGRNVAEINVVDPHEVQQRASRVRQKQLRRFVVQHRLANGEIRDVEVYSGPITLNGRQLLYSIVHDISEQRRLEGQLRQAQKMEAIGTLAGGIAHDFNNILAAMLGYTEMAKEKQEPGSQARMFLDNVLKAGERAKELVRHILAFSRKRIETMGPVDIRTVVDEALRLLRASLPTTIEIRQQLSDSCGFVYGESTQIHQVVMNLCTNAAQAMEEGGGVLTVNLAVVGEEAAPLPQLTGRDPGCYVALTVSDTGVGIAPEALERIFDPYFTTKPVGKGSGLGLAVVSGIVKSCGGTIQVESTPGRGTRFVVCLPTVDAPQEVILPATGPVVGRGVEHLLLVDDEPSLLDVTRRRLEGLGYTVTGTTNSMKALELFMNGPDRFDLLLTDQTMPGITGIDFAREAKRVRPLLPIILCTGYSSKVDLEQVDHGAVDRVFLKPVDYDLLGRTVRELLDRSAKPDRSRSEDNHLASPG